jgi:hypothetical protein
VAGNSLDKRVVWFRNLGAGVYGPAQQLVGNVSTPYDVELEDLDGDGDLDVLFITLLEGSMLLCRNLGAGVFAPAALQPPLNDFSLVLEVGDVDGDGDADAIVGGNSRVLLLKNNGAGQFAAPLVIEASSQDCRGLALADVDGDLDLDLAATSVFGGTLALYRNQSGTFQSKQVLSNSLLNAQVLRAADVDTDGDFDLLVGTFNPSTNSAALQRLSNNGAGAFATPVLVADQMAVLVDLRTADLDADGILDLVSATWNDGRIGWHKNLGGGSFGLRVELTLGLNQSRQVVAADIDADGDADVLALEDGSPDLLWYRNQGLGGFAPPAVLLSAPGILREFALLDADLDGDQDLALAGPFGLVYRRNDGTGQFSAPSALAGANKIGWGVASGDLDGDGEVDLCFTYDETAGLSFGPTRVGQLINRGGGVFPLLEQIAVSTGGSQLQVEDLTGSSLPDILYVLGYFQIPAYLQNLGTQGFAAPVLVPGSVIGSSTVEAKDLDGDLDRDLLLADAGGVRYLENQAGSFVPPKPLISGSYRGARHVDLDADGTPDLLLAASPGVRWAKGLGGTSFAAPTPIDSSFLFATRLAVADLDADGGLDPIAADFFSQRLSWFKNLLAGDCDQSGTVDALEIASGTLPDCDGNGVPDGCDLLQPGADIDQDGQLDACVPPALVAQGLELSAAAGGAQRLELRGPPGALYGIAGSLSGTSPGTPFGGALVPLQFDAYTLLSLELANQPPFTETFGTLDNLGFADALITLPAGSSPALAGLLLHHAFVALSPSFDVALVSNPVPLALH